MTPLFNNAVSLVDRCSSFLVGIGKWFRYEHGAGASQNIVDVGVFSTLPMTETQSGRINVTLQCDKVM
jgi:hypothetical protein